MRCLGIGYGSIGSRHTRLLADLGCEVEVVSRNESCPFPRFSSIEDAVAADKYDFYIISNKTSDHGVTLEQLNRLICDGAVLVEKPVFDTTARYSEYPNLKGRIYVAYNLRFHPILQDIHAHLAGKKILCAQFYVGQYLPDWRPGTDYTQSYSASRKQGGGVLRDLSHELDLSCWLLGDWQAVTALGGHFSELDIDSDDVFSLLMRTSECPAVSIQMNYLDRQTRREIVINAEGTSLKADLVAGILEIDGAIRKYELHRDVTYRSQLEAFLNDPASSHLCSFEEGLDVLRLVEAAEQASKTLTWVKR